MTIRGYFNILLSRYRPLARYEVIRAMKELGVSPAFVTYTLYLILGVPHRLDGDFLEGPIHIGSIHFDDIGFYGRGKIEPEFDLDLAGEVYSYSIKRVARLVDIDSIAYYIKAYAYRLSRQYEEYEELLRHIEEEMSLAPNGSNINVFIDRDEVLLELHYLSPIASMSYHIGSFYAYSVAYSLEGMLGTLVEEFVEVEDEYTLVAAFKFM